MSRGRRNYNLNPPTQLEAEYAARRWREIGILAWGVPLLGILAAPFVIMTVVTITLITTISPLVTFPIFAVWVAWVLLHSRKKHDLPANTRRAFAMPQHEGIRL